MTPKKRAILSWSSGKDSAWALHLLRRCADIEVAALAQTIPTGIRRIGATLSSAAKIDGLDERVNADIAIISRRDGGDAVVMSLDHYQQMAETLYLLSSPANARHLAESIKQYRDGKSSKRELIDPDL